MRSRLNPASGVPVYLQLAEQFKRDIQAGALQPGDVLPDIPDLATELVVNPNAVARAYQALAREGVIELREDVSALRAIARPWLRRSSPAPVATAGDWELDAARDVQQRLLPQQYPPVVGIEYSGFYRPARAVGGDYYDFIRRSPTELTLVIGDVCGKGVPAALLMATLRAFLLGETRHGADSPAAVVRTLNQLVCGSFATNRFASFFYGHLDASTRTLRYVNAGHPPPLVCGPSRRGTNVTRLRHGGPVLGLLPDCTYEEGCIRLEPDDVFLAFTDGVTEATNDSEEEWGEDALVQIAGRGSSSARQVIEAIVRAADAFAGGAPQHDDMTLVGIRVMKDRSHAVPA
jgi:serine phosphatase RsbU (regulator of sigma subunit)